MPEADGYNLTKRLRAAGVAVPVVALATDMPEKIEHDCIDGHFDAYLQKPMTRKQLYKTIDRFLQADKENE